MFLKLWASVKWLAEGMEGLPRGGIYRKSRWSESPLRSLRRKEGKRGTKVNSKDALASVKICR